jgi:hypothetical protein
MSGERAPGMQSTGTWLLSSWSRKATSHFGHRTLIMNPLSVFPVILRTLNPCYSLLNKANDTVLNPDYTALKRKNKTNVCWTGRESKWSRPVSVCDWGQWDNKNFSLTQRCLLEQPKQELLKWDDLSVNTSTHLQMRQLLWTLKRTGGDMEHSCPILRYGPGFVVKSIRPSLRTANCSVRHWKL